MSEVDALQKYDDLCARIYADKRMPHGTRELALALAWVYLRDPARHDPDSGGSLRRVGYLLGRTHSGQWRHKLLFAEDAPRYEENDGRWANSPGRCIGPRLRPFRSRTSTPDTATSLRPHTFHDGYADPGNVCGANGSIRVREYDLVTGQLRAEHWFCRRHKEHADRVRGQIGALGERPEPIPNVGGLLPCYFQDEAVEPVYRWARPGWVPPYYGICADDWPVPGQRTVPRRPRLSLVMVTP